MRDFGKFIAAFLISLLAVLPAGAAEGDMTVGRLDEIITALNPDAERPGGGTAWRFELDGVRPTVIADAKHDRMRILVAVARADTLSPAALVRIMQANFDTALDARYAIAKDIVWAAYIHPLSPLRAKQFVSALGQTVTLAKTFGTTFTSGGLTFGGGDSRGILKDRLLDILKKKGIEI